MKIARCFFMFVIVLAFMLATTGCASVPTPVPPTVEPTAVPATITSTFESTLRVVLDKNFKKDEWCNGGSYPFGDFYCQDGEFHAIAKGVGNIASPGGSYVFVDFVVETQMRIIGDSGAYGVEFRGRQSSPASFYIFQVRPSGQYQLIKWSQEKSQNAVLIPWTDSPSIKKGAAANLLRVMAQGDQITLFANGDKLANISDASFSQGFASPVATEQGHVAVSTFQVLRPLP